MGWPDTRVRRVAEEHPVFANGQQYADLRGRQFGLLWFASSAIADQQPSHIIAKVGTTT